MSGRLCFVCNEPNYSGNETLITVKRLKRKQENGTQSTQVWKGMICDECLHKHFGLLKQEVES